MARRRRHPGQQAQWLLKAPVHLMEMEALIGAYPDACFIRTHRDPREFTDLTPEAVVAPFSRYREFITSRGIRTTA